MSLATADNLPVITQCEIRKLYGQKNEPGTYEAIELAKTYERRRCGHHPDQYPEPLSTQECIRSVVDPKETNQNKHRYVVASQEVEVRRMLRTIHGVPQIYIKRSVMILEPMADESVQIRAREEKSKFRAEIKNALGKRKREDKEGDDAATGQPKAAEDAQAAEKKKKKGAGPKGPKGPNPLSVKKAKKKTQDGETPKEKATKPVEEEEATQDVPTKPKRKRRRKNKTADGGIAGEGEDKTPAGENEDGVSADAE